MTPNQPSTLNLTPEIKEFNAERSNLVNRSLNIIAISCLLACVLEFFTYKKVEIFALFIGCALMMVILRKIKLWQSARTTFVPLAIISIVSLVFSFLRPEAYYVGVLGPIIAFALIMLVAPPKLTDGISMMVYFFFLVAIVISFMSPTVHDKSGETLYRITALGAMGAALILLLRQYHKWITRLLAQTEEANHELKIARDSLEEQVQIRTHQLEEQNIRLDLAHQEALRLSQVKSDFLATMSHEIRTPMNGILGMSELLLTSGLNEYQQDLANVVFESGQGLLVLLNDVLDFSRIESGQFRVDIKPFDLKSCVDDVSRLMSARARENGITLDIHWEELPDQVQSWQAIGDAARVRQVLFNLVGNAVKFTKKGFVKIELQSRNDKIICKVLDSGHGVPEKFRPSLFQPFMQAEPPNVRHEGGTGLGLAISKRLMDLMNGEIGYEPEPSGGSQFWFSLPKA